jgi:small subunit ribosomal protein S6e
VVGFLKNEENGDNMEFKIVINDKDKSYQVVSDTDILLGKKIGDKFKGDSIDLPGYEFEITGGSDKEGFPMRKDLSGTKRKKALLTGGVGFNPKRKGLKRRKSIRGNTISEDVVQVNCRTVTAGKKALSELLKKGESETTVEESNASSS